MHCINTLKYAQIELNISLSVFFFFPHFIYLRNFGWFQWCRCRWQVKPVIRRKSGSCIFVGHFQIKFRYDIKLNGRHKNFSQPKRNEIIFVDQTGSNAAIDAMLRNEMRFLFFSFLLGATKKNSILASEFR